MEAVAKQKVVGMLFSQPTALHPSGPSPGRCSRTPPPTCTRGSGWSRTRWRRCCRAALGPAVSPFYHPIPLPRVGQGAGGHWGPSQPDIHQCSLRCRPPPLLAGHPWWPRSEGALL